MGIREEQALANTLPKLCDDPRWPELVNKASPYQDQRDDKGHTALVCSWAAVLLEDFSEDPEIRKPFVLAAALLHDIGWSCLNPDERRLLFQGDPDNDSAAALRLKHEKEGVSLADKLLQETGYSESERNSICRMIDGHDSRKEDLSPEDGIFRDADALWMVTETGFAADLRRRQHSRSEWCTWLKKRFTHGRSFYSSRARIYAGYRLSLLEKNKVLPMPGSDTPPRILICHYRVGWTDGVSLEIEKRQDILEEMGYECRLLAGPGSRGADFEIEELDFDTDLARKISRNAFGGLKDYTGEAELMQDIRELSRRIEEKVTETLENWAPDFILLHNIFSHGRHISAARAFRNALKAYRAPSLCTHHDFYWERDDFRNPSTPGVEDFLSRYVPPVIPGMRHAVINTPAGQALINKRGINAMVFPDTLDFSLKPWEKDDFNALLLKDFDLNPSDIFVLQATRIVRRKGIELIPPLLALLNSPEYLDKLKGKTLYNGKKTDSRTRITFLMAGYAEQEALPYKKELETLLNDRDVPYRFLQPYIAAERGETGGRRIYSLFDCYPFADLVSYPSLFEGWGNQFIEAVFARKPVIVNEYPVYRSDIKPMGYKVISLGQEASPGPTGLYELPEKLLRQSCDQIISWLLGEDTPEKLDHNFTLADSNNSYDTLRCLISESMAHYEPS